MPSLVYFHHPYSDMLMEFNDFGRVGDKFVCKLGDVHQSVLMDPDVDKSTEVGDVCDYAWKFHARYQVVRCFHVGVEFKYFYLITWVQSWLFKFFHNVVEGGHTDAVADILFQINLFAFL